MGKQNYDLPHQTFEQQLDTLLDRGIIIDDRKKALKILENISYYKIKEFAKPFEKIIDGKLNYSDTHINQVIGRFYQDKNIRIYLLHAIEQIELSIKTKISHELGKKNSFHYLEFKNWVDKNPKKITKEKVLYKEDVFKKVLRKQLSKTNKPQIIDFKDNYTNEFPPIWMAVDILTFGTIVEMWDLMSNARKNNIVSYYNSTIDEFTSWLNHLQFIRNQCAHNSNIVDLKIITMPKLKKEWEESLYKLENGLISDRLASTFFIVHQLVKIINPDYSFSNLYGAISKNAQFNSAARRIGFKDSKSIKFLIKK